MSDIYIVKAQFGVKGYVDSEKEYKGTMAEVKAAIEKDGVDLARQMTEADEQDGDLRQFCPQFANGYPTLAGFEAEWGEDFNITIIDVSVTKTIVATVELNYHDKDYAAIRVVAEGWF